jgi:sterol desaturase/sphingolipid hydroxylase (fatty acid hydroxylase superfamily)
MALIDRETGRHVVSPACILQASRLSPAAVRSLLKAGPPMLLEELHLPNAGIWSYLQHHLYGVPALTVLALLLLMSTEFITQDWNKTAIYRLFVRRSASAKIDLVFWLLQYSGFAFLVSVVFSFGLAIVGARLANFTADRLSWARIELPSDGILQIAFSFLIYWLTMNFFSYWTHRISHLTPFWHVHRFHHAAPELNFVTVYRIHPAEAILDVVNFLSPLLFLKVSSSVLLVSFFVSQFVTFCQHSELTWDWGWIGRWIFGSPSVHQLHHSIDEEHRDKNFANCPLWDRVFGTWYDGSKKPSGYGIPDPAYEKQPAKQFLLDSWIMYRSIGQWALQAARKMIGYQRGVSVIGTSTRDGSPLPKENSGA